VNPHENPWNETTKYIDLSRVDWEAIGELVSRPIIEPPTSYLGGAGVWENYDDKN
jgi:hypothetical protein